MTLRKQLLLVSLLLLLLPWGGCQYLRGVDEALRQAQGQNLLDIGNSLTQQLQKTTSYEDYYNSRGNKAAIYASPLRSQPIVDGYADDWQSYGIAPLVINGSPVITLLSGEYRQQVYFLLKMTDDFLRYFNPLTNDLYDADHVTLYLNDRTYHLYTSAPGPLVARWRDEQGHIREQYGIAGVWQETINGYQLELSIDKAFLKQGFDIEVVDYQPQLLREFRFSQLMENADQLILTEMSPDLQKTLEQLPISTSRMVLFNRYGHEMAAVNSSQTVAALTDLPWLLEWFYRRALMPDSLPSLPSLSNNAVIEAQSEVGVQWYRYQSRQFKPQMVARLLLPLHKNEEAMGYLLIEKTTDQWIQLTSTAFNRFFIYNLLIVLIIVLGLVFYASWLSWRILRLSRAAAIAVENNGYIKSDLERWPDRYCRDELGRLSRNYQQLLMQIQEYHRYLRSLASKLSHEMRTPIAIVRSSLDNLSEGVFSKQQQVYQQRAQQGIERLNRMLTAMSSVNRLEDSLSDADMKPVDLSVLLQSLVVIYQDVYPQCHFELESTLASADVEIAEELWVQMLDKLVDNAISFSEKDSLIIIRLYENATHYYVSVENTGPLLPDSMLTQLCEPMVSIRDGASSTASTHLGLGLYIVRLIAELHRGKIILKNRADNTGVCAIVTVPKPDQIIRE